MALTTRLSLPYPVDADTADVPTWMRNLALLLDDQAAVDAQGPIASRPTAGKRGSLYTSTNEGAAPITYRDDGATWRRVSGIPRVTSLPTNPADGDVVAWIWNNGQGQLPIFLMRFASPSYWEFIGGMPATYRYTSQAYLGAVVHPLYSAVEPGPVTIPYAGWWMFRYGVNVQVTPPQIAGLVSIWMAIMLNAFPTSQPSRAYHEYQEGSVMSGDWQGVVGKNSVISLAGAMSPSGGAVTCTDGWLEITPQRITIPL